MKDLATFFKDKRNLINFLVLLILILAIPLSVNLVRQRQIIKSRAVAPAIVFGGPNVIEVGGVKKLKLNARGEAEVDLLLTSHLGQVLSATAEASPAPGALGK